MPDPPSWGRPETVCERISLAPFGDTKGEPMKITKPYLLGMILIIVVAAAAPVEAQSGSDEWEFQLAPFYLWATTLEGDLTARGRDASIVLPFDEAFDKLEATFTIHFEAWKGRWGLLTDFNYIDLESDAAVDALNLTISLENLIAEASIAHLFDDRAFFYFGARYYGLESAITGDLGRGLQTDKDWVDPILGFGWRPALGKRWTLGTRFDIGGFGVNSKLTWNAQAVIDWRIGKFIALGAGYRALDIDYEEESEGFGYAVRHHGPAAYLRFFF